LLWYSTYYFWQAGSIVLLLQLICWFVCITHTQIHYWRAELSDLTVGLLIRSLAIFCQEKDSQATANVLHIVNTHVMFWKYSRCWKLLSSALKQISSLLKGLFDTSLSSVTLIDVIVSLLFCWVQLVYGNCLNTCCILGFPTDTNHRDVSLETLKVSSVIC
jgi:hypothetical protein